jgi:hypothetical protein
MRPIYTSAGIVNCGIPESLRVQQLPLQTQNSDILILYVNHILNTYYLTYIYLIYYYYLS